VIGVVGTAFGALEMALASGANDALAALGPAGSAVELPAVTVGAKHEHRATGCAKNETMAVQVPTLAAT
jgi:hypothetical protein